MTKVHRDQHAEKPFQIYMSLIWNCLNTWDLSESHQECPARYQQCCDIWMIYSSQGAQKRFTWQVVFRLDRAGLQVKRNKCKFMKLSVTD